MITLCFWGFSGVGAFLCAICFCDFLLNYQMNVKGKVKNKEGAHVSPFVCFKIECFLHIAQ